MGKTPVVVLVRVALKKQNTDRQITELMEVASRNDWEVVEVCSETVSGSASVSERYGLQRALQLVESGKAKKVLVHEVAMLARVDSIAHRFVERLQECGASLYWHSQRMETLLPDGTINPDAHTMLAVLAEIARSEVETLRERVKSGLDEARRKGVRLGRPTGSSMSDADYLAGHKDVAKFLRAGHSIRNTATLAGCSPATVQRVKRLIG
jgi:DNA invertase Pin-like site-specific DNA recombinase